MVPKIRIDFFLIFFHKTPLNNLYFEVLGHFQWTSPKKGLIFSKNVKFLSFLKFLEVLSLIAKLATWGALGLLGTYFPAKLVLNR